MKDEIKWLDMKLAPETMEFQEWQDYLMKVVCSVYGISEAVFNEKLKLDIDRLHKVHFIYSRERRFGNTFYACMCVLGYMDVLKKGEIIPIVLPNFTLVTIFLNTLSNCMILYSGEEFRIESIIHKCYVIKTSKSHSTHYLKFYSYDSFNARRYYDRIEEIEPIIDHSKID